MPITRRAKKRCLEMERDIMNVEKIRDVEKLGKLEPHGEVNWGFFLFGFGYLGGKWELG